MKEIFYRPENGWVGDTIPFSHDGKFYIFYLHDERKGNTEDEYGYRTSWNLLITEDGVEIEDCGAVLPVGEYEDADYACYTGSVLSDREGRFHIFYTAQNNYNPKYFRDGRPMQYIMHAVSRDLIHWEKDRDFLLSADESIYEPYDWRDPYVFYEEKEKCYYMLLAARLRGASEQSGGCVGLCRSFDLLHWEAQQPFYQPDSYMTHECPDLFRMGGKYYLLYSTFSEKFVTHYRVSDSLHGPWRAPIEDSLDGRAFYAAKTAERNGERWAFAWIPTRRGETDFGQYEWGGSLHMHRLSQKEGKRLTVQPPEALTALFQKDITPEDALRERIEAENWEGKSRISFDGMPESCMIEADLSFSEGSRVFGLSLRQDTALSEGYYFRFEPFYNRVVMDRWPRREKGVNQWYIDGDKPFLIELERPLDYRKLPDRRLHIRLISDKSILCLYVNDELALSARAYSGKGTHWGFFVQDGAVSMEHIRIYARSE
ncbi:glycosyl hydrolase family 32 [Oribacterium sp. oral taxon 078 str. F0262]|uniref:glycoside hydrolase family 32 protein n=1 Tax=Oribacterium sp. oral taxon 078 TaxID=652706 RepID=UPI0001BCBC88|nr:glycoside hydrolase family 32 protein [Oribacterium sp. oral taxon 078]EFE92542.1 glycosyl hydrolase family 32 [Oribacterium sp. oral taxon 078 str. F0262]